MLSDAAVNDMEKTRGVLLSDDQRRVLQGINTSRSGVQTIAAHAGTGKTMLSGFLLQAIVPLLSDAFSVLMLTPSRDLRDELVESNDCVAPFAAQGEVLWLGRAAAGKNSNRLWEKYMGDKVEEELKNEKDRLNRSGETMKQHHQELMKLNLPWKKILGSGDITEAADIRVQLVVFKRAARSHMLQLIMTIVRARSKIIQRLIAKVHIFVSTCDAWCKWRAGFIKGTIGAALALRDP